MAESKKSSKMTVTQLTKLAQADPKLAESVYHDNQESEAQQAFAKFQQNLQNVPKNGHTKMYDYVHFNDLKAVVNNAMKNTGLTWHQVPKYGSVVTIPQLDNHGRPSFQLNYQKTHQESSGYGKYKRTFSVHDPLVNQNGEAMQIMTKGEQVGVSTIITYKNGEPLAHGYMSAVAQSTSPQDVGSALTYCRRYSLSIATGASSDDDDDGQQQNGGSRVGANSNNQPNYISSSQLSELNNMINKSAKKVNKPAKTIAQYISQNFAGYQPLNHMFKSKFNQAKALLQKNS